MDIDPRSLPAELIEYLVSLGEGVELEKTIDQLFAGSESSVMRYVSALIRAKESILALRAKPYIERTASVPARQIGGLDLPSIFYSAKVKPIDPITGKFIPENLYDEDLVHRVFFESTRGEKRRARLINNLLAPGNELFQAQREMYLENNIIRDIAQAHISSLEAPAESSKARILSLNRQILEKEAEKAYISPDTPIGRAQLKQVKSDITDLYDSLRRESSSFRTANRRLRDAVSVFGPSEDIVREEIGISFNDQGILETVKVRTTKDVLDDLDPGGVRPGLIQGMKDLTDRQKIASMIEAIESAKRLNPSLTAAHYEEMDEDIRRLQSIARSINKQELYRINRGRLSLDERFSRVILSGAIPDEITGESSSVLLTGKPAKALYLSGKRVNITNAFTDVEELGGAIQSLEKSHQLLGGRSVTESPLEKIPNAVSVEVTAENLVRDEVMRRQIRFTGTSAVPRAESELLDFFSKDLIKSYKKAQLKTALNRGEVYDDFLERQARSVSGGIKEIFSREGISGSSFDIQGQGIAPDTAVLIRKILGKKDNEIFNFTPEKFSQEFIAQIIYGNSGNFNSLKLVKKLMTTPDDRLLAGESAIKKSLQTVIPELNNLDYNKLQLGVFRRVIKQGLRDRYSDIFSSLPLSRADLMRTAASERAAAARALQRAEATFTPSMSEIFYDKHFAGPEEKVLTSFSLSDELVEAGIPRREADIRASQLEKLTTQEIRNLIQGSGETSTPQIEVLKKYLQRIENKNSEKAAADRLKRLMVLSEKLNAENKPRMAQSIQKEIDFIYGRMSAGDLDIDGQRLIDLDPLRVRQLLFSRIQKLEKDIGYSLGPDITNELQDYLTRKITQFEGPAGYNPFFGEFSEVLANLEEIRSGQMALQFQIPAISELRGFESPQSVPVRVQEVLLGEEAIEGEGQKRVGIAFEVLGPTENRVRATAFLHHSRLRQQAQALLPDGTPEQISAKVMELAKAEVQAGADGGAFLEMRYRGLHETAAEITEKQLSRRAQDLEIKLVQNKAVEDMMRTGNIGVAYFDIGKKKPIVFRFGGLGKPTEREVVEFLEKNPALRAQYAQKAVNVISGMSLGLLEPVLAGQETQLSTGTVTIRQLNLRLQNAAGAAPNRVFQSRHQINLAALENLIAGGEQRRQGASLLTLLQEGAALPGGESANILLGKVSVPFDYQLQQMKVTELRSVAKKLGLKNYSRATKQQLLDLIASSRPDLESGLKPLKQVLSEAFQQEGLDFAAVQDFAERFDSNGISISREAAEDLLNKNYALGSPASIVPEISGQQAKIYSPFDLKRRIDIGGEYQTTVGDLIRAIINEESGTQKRGFAVLDANGNITEISTARAYARTIKHYLTSISDNQQIMSTLDNSEKGRIIQRSLTQALSGATNEARTVDGATSTVVNSASETFGDDFIRFRQEQLRAARRGSSAAEAVATEGMRPAAVPSAKKMLADVAGLIKEDKMVRYGAYALGAIVSAGLIKAALGSNKQDVTKEEMAGPPNLPGGNPYTGTMGPGETYTAMGIPGYQPSAASFQEGGVTYQVNARGNYDPSVLQSEIEAITESQIGGTISRGITNQQLDYEDLAGDF